MQYRWTHLKKLTSYLVCHLKRPKTCPSPYPKTRQSQRYLVSFIIVSAERRAVRNLTSSVNCPHRDHAECPLESLCRLDEFWQTPATSPLQIPQVSKSGWGQTAGHSTSPSLSVSPLPQAVLSRLRPGRAVEGSDFSFLSFRLRQKLSVIFLFLGA